LRFVCEGEEQTAVLNSLDCVLARRRARYARCLLLVVVLAETTEVHSMFSFFFCRCYIEIHYSHFALLLLLVLVLVLFCVALTLSHRFTPLAIANRKRKIVQSTACFAKRFLFVGDNGSPRAG
jgi:hypothetical protein